MRARITGGLSPRVRGKPTRPWPAAPPMRSIPACAGEARGCSSGRKMKRVYPRVCGGSSLRKLLTSAGHGLSPRVRGKRRRATMRLTLPRSIPACAGEAFFFVPAPGFPAVYPRVCGGSLPRKNQQNRAGGLSPRVRGKLGGPMVVRASARSIPACAGEARHRKPGPATSPVYPRVCGGSLCRRRVNPAQMGLSPRVRGKLRGMRQESSSPGSIPACAGEALHILLISPRGRRSIPACAGEAAPVREARQRPGVYPRVCGGSVYNPLSASQRQGLSPRVRGKRSRRNPAAGGNGSIPACAGKPGEVPPGRGGGRSIPACAGEARNRRRPGSRGGVYPRVCGGSLAGDVTGVDVGGLSPRVRGKPFFGDSC